MKHTALTIGPIITSLNQAHKTREIWAASYFFTNLMEQIINQLIGFGIKPDQFVIPYPYARKEFDKENIFLKSGVFPDRLILKSENGLYDSLVENTETVFKKIIDEIESANVCKGQIQEYFNNYVRKNIIEIEIKQGNVVDEVNKILAFTELQNNVILEDNQCFLTFLENINQTSLYKNIFGNNFSYPSIIEISTRRINKGKDLERNELNSIIKAGKEELKKMYKGSFENRTFEDDDFLVAGLSVTKEIDFRNSHKYIAIVQSDGDNVGKLIGKIYNTNPELIKDFSKALSKYSLDAVKEINKYGGEAIYAGGDDLLFFAPVMIPMENIFTLIKKLSSIFTETLSSYEELQNLIESFKKEKDECGIAMQPPTLSFGLSITYYKYPMHEALVKSRKLLFEEAKSGAKNQLAYSFQKHSGQSFDGLIRFDSILWNNFINMLNQNEVKIISSLIYNLETHKSILSEIIADPDRLKNYFKNFYDESFHKDNDIFIENFRTYLSETYNEFNDYDKTINEVYNTLRINKFLKSNKDE